MIGNKGNVDLSMLNTGVPYVTFTSDTAMTMTPKYTNSGITLEYSTNGGESWVAIVSGVATSSSTTLSFRGQATGTKSLFTADTSGNAWAITGGTNVVATGNLNYLLCDVMGSEIAPTRLADNCYSWMFFGTSLITAPALPATRLATNCYHAMFRRCTSLTTPPTLPATRLADNCYNAIFFGCAALTTAPALPATTLAASCYTWMFYNCTSLTTAPELPATTLADNCYQYMLTGCTSLILAPALPATTLTPYCYNQMLRSCASLTTVPELPATVLTTNCYQYMFLGCTPLKVSATQGGIYQYAWRIPTSGTGTTANNWNTSMLNGTGGTFTANPAINTTYYVENIPV